MGTTPQYLYILYIVLLPNSELSSYQMSSFNDTLCYIAWKSASVPAGVEASLDVRRVSADNFLSQGHLRQQRPRREGDSKRGIGPGRTLSTLGLANMELVHSLAAHSSVHKLF